MAQTTTLAEVGRKAAKEPQFWKALRKDAGAALVAAGLMLEKKDLEKLKRMLDRKNVSVIVTADADKLERIIPIPGKPWTPWNEGDIDWATWPPE